MQVSSAAVLSGLFSILLYFVYVAHGRYQAWRFLSHGREIILKAASSCGKTCFSIPVFGWGGRMHIVTTAKHWDDMRDANPDHLSQRLWVKEFVQPHHSLMDAWPISREDEGMPIIRAIRTTLATLPRLKAPLLEIINRDLDRKIQSSPKDGEFAALPLMGTMTVMMIRMNTYLILGPEAAKDIGFLIASIGTIKRIAQIGQALRMWPSFLAPLVAKWVKGKDKDRPQEYVREVLTRHVEQRRRLSQGKPDGVPEPTTVLEAFVDTCPAHFTVSDTVAHLNILFTTTTLAIGTVTTQFIKDLYSHDALHARIRDELRQAEDLTTPSGPRRTSALESLFMESMRRNCGQVTAVHRTAVKPFTFSDGYTVPAGQSVQFYQAGMHLSEKYYTRPETFDPGRFQGGNRSVTDVGMEWPFWGVGKFACPGRYYFSFAAKLLAATLLTEYDCKLKTPVPANYQKGENTVPSQELVLLVKKGTQAKTEILH